MVSLGLAENVDFTTVKKFTVVNQGGTKEIGDYLLTIDAAKHIAMVQRSEKGKKDFFFLRNASDSSKILPLPYKQQ